MSGKPPFRPLGLDHLLLVVKDLDETLAFYTDVVGLTVDHRLPEYGMIELRPGVALVDAACEQGAWARAEPRGGRNLDHFAMAIEGCDEAALRAHLAAHKVAIEEERDEDGALSLYVRDPSGNAVELISRAPR